MTLLVCRTCKNRRLGNLPIQDPYGVGQADTCAKSGKYLWIYHDKATSAASCPFSAYKEKLSFCKKVESFLSPRIIQKQDDEKADPRNIAAEMIALDVLKNKLFPTVRSEPGDGSYCWRTVREIFKSDKFEFSIVQKEGRNNLPAHILKTEFAASNGFELTGYGEKILIEAANKLKKMKQDEDRVKAEYDSKQAAIDFIEKRLGLNSPVSSTGV